MVEITEEMVEVAATAYVGAWRTENKNKDVDLTQAVALFINPIGKALDAVAPLIEAAVREECATILLRKPLPLFGEAILRQFRVRDAAIAAAIRAPLKPAKEG